LYAALRATNTRPPTPDDAARSAFVERLASDFPEVASVAKQIRVPRQFVPAPPAVVPRPPVAEEPETLIEPAQRRIRERAPAKEQAKGTPAPAPPPLVDPKNVKYDR